MKKLMTLAITCCVMMLGIQSFASIHGIFGACVGSSRTLFDSTSSGIVGGGTWSSSNPGVATVGATTGVVTGVAVGTAVITLVSTTSGTSTAIFTVSPIPAAITGSIAPFCTGSTITLSCATAGGTWSSGTGSVATVSSTGVVTGHGGGTAGIYYSTGVGCSASTIVTVTGTPAIDSVYGATEICVGSSSTFTCSTPGGTWSVSDPAIGTISATGVVTAVSVGALFITYSVTGACAATGTSVRMTYISNSTPIGTISGTTTAYVGLTTTLSNATGGGTWSSSTPTVATISSTGVVTGVMPGTTVISYTKNGCGGIAHATTIVTVNIANCISGNITYTTGIPTTGWVTVWLIKYDPVTLMLTAVDSTMVHGTGGTASYYFCGMGTDSFRVKAATDTGYSPMASNIPTYHTSSAFWNSATVIYHVSGTHDINKDINMGFGVSTTGPGFIAGNVLAGANKGTAEGDPVPNQLVFCVDNSTGNILKQTKTNALGQYSFSNLPLGTSYTIRPELMNFTTTPYPTITLTSSSSSFTAASFRKNSLPKTITPITVDIAEVNATSAGISVFPNPAKGIVNVSWNNGKAGVATITVSDITGRTVLNTTVDMTDANGVTKLDVSSLNAGIFLVSVTTDVAKYNAKISVQ